MAKANKNILLEEAKKQEKTISIIEIKAIVEKLLPDYYKKILISDDTPVLRSNFFYVRYEGKQIKRFIKRLKFPVFGAVIQEFEKYTDNALKKPEKSLITDEIIFELVKELYQISPESTTLTSKEVLQPLDFPLETDVQGELIKEQAKYYFPNLVGITKAKAQFTTGEVEGDFYVLVFAETKIDFYSQEQILLKEGVELDPEAAKKIWNFCHQKTPLQLIRSNYKVFDSKSKAIENTDEYALFLSEELRKMFPEKPEIVEEKIHYHIIPCIQISYRHVLTNTIEEMTILNVLDTDAEKKNIVIHLHSAPEEGKKNMNEAAKETAKKVGGFFSKMFNTKAHRSKEDKKNEINLMIRVARADGKIQDEEKRKLSEIIGGLEEFTQADKQKFYDLMSSEQIAELKDQDLVFSNEEVINEVLLRLEEISEADGKVVASEKQIISQIKERMIAKKKTTQTNPPKE